ncbi:hypothetical protein [Streptomyces sp. NPDC001980]|uniref:hypothetical protein n=1 Tax=Streptomyces sp. NPDC001980 TaxID=3157126 RepID=UPI0033317A5A
MPQGGRAQHGVDGVFVAVQPRCAQQSRSGLRDGLTSDVEDIELLTAVHPRVSTEKV